MYLFHFRLLDIFFVNLIVFFFLNKRKKILTRELFNPKRAIFFKSLFNGYGGKWHSETIFKCHIFNFKKAFIKFHQVF